MTIAAQIARTNAVIESASRAGQFVSLCKYLMLGARGAVGGPGLTCRRAAELAEQDGVRGPVVDILKAATSAGGFGGGTTWGSQLADLKLLATAFAGSLSNAGVFDALLSSMIPIPLSATAGVITTGAQGYVVGENSAKQISRLSLTNATITPRKAHAAVIASNELLRFGGPATNALLTRDLVAAATAAVDKEFLQNVLLSGVSVGTSSGNTAQAARADVANLLTQVPLGRSSRPYLVTTARVAAMWASMGSTSTSGQGAFPELGPMGGTVCGIPALIADEDTLPSGALPAGYVVLVDASGIAAGALPPEPSTISEGAIVSDSAPNSPQTGSDVVESLWQGDKSALRIERWFAAAKLRTAAVAALVNANSYQTGFSPP